MVTGASTADLAVILIDARHGVLTQSKRHGFIASLLGIPHLVVAVNKMDLVGYDQERLRADQRRVHGFRHPARLRRPHVHPDQRAAGRQRRAQEPPHALVRRHRRCLTHLENVHIGGDRNLIDFRFPVQCVVRPDQSFRGYSGQVASGVVRVGR